MAKIIPTTGNILFNAVTYYAIEITTDFSVEEGDVTDGNTGGDGREYLAGRVARSLSCKLWIDDATAEIVEGATGAMTLIAKAGTTDKAWAWTNATITSKSINVNPNGSDGIFANYTFRLDGATTATQLT